MWNRNWVRGWLVILAVALVYELTGAYLEWRGVMAYPTLSRLIVGTIPQPLLTLLTLGIAAWLCWHWTVVKRREPSAAEWTPYDAPIRIMFFAMLVLFLGAGVGVAIPALTNIGVQTFHVKGEPTMFDPLTAALVYLLTEGFKYLNKFLNDNGFPLIFDGWPTLALAIVTAAIIVLNQLGGNLPPDLARWIPLLVTIVLDVLGAIGIKATIKMAGGK